MLTLVSFKYFASKLYRVELGVKNIYADKFHELSHQSTLECGHSNKSAFRAMAFAVSKPEDAFNETNRN